MNVFNSLGTERGLSFKVKAFRSLQKFEVPVHTSVHQQLELTARGHRLATYSSVELSLSYLI